MESEDLEYLSNLPGLVWPREGMSVDLTACGLSPVDQKRLAQISRTAIPKLIARVEELEAEVKSLSEEAELAEEEDRMSEEQITKDAKRIEELERALREMLNWIDADAGLEQIARERAYKALEWKD